MLDHSQVKIINSFLNELIFIIKFNFYILADLKILILIIHKYYLKMVSF